MTQILMVCEEQLFADAVFASLMCADLPDEINFTHLSPRRQMHSAVNTQTVDIIIYVSSGLRQEDISLISRIRRQNPEVRQINIISDLDNVVRTDPRIEYMHRNNRFEVLEEMVRNFMRQQKKETRIKTANNIVKTARISQVNAIMKNITRLNELDALVEKGDKDGFISLYRDILEVAFNQAKRFSFAQDLIRRSVSLYLNVFRVRYALDLSGVDAEFLSVLDNPNPSHRQFLRLFFRISDIVFTKTVETQPVEIIVKAKKYIQKNFKTDLTLTAVAEEIGANPSYLSRLFTQTEGQTMGMYIAHLKTEEAKRLLTQTDITVGKISQRLGFRSANYFIRFFKKHVGVPPQVYRESN